MALKHGIAIIVCAAACGSDAATAPSLAESSQVSSQAAAMPNSSASGSSAANTAQAGTTATASTATAGGPGGATPPTQSPPAGASADAGAPVQGPASGQPQAGSGGAAASAQTNQGPAPVISLMVEADRVNMYDDATNWLCLPGDKYDLCTKDLDATVVRADGTTELEPHVVAEDPKFDCFYVYPTLALSVLADPSDPRADDISGDITADWGLHLVDVHIAMGNLVELAASEHAAFAAQP